MYGAIGLLNSTEVSSAEVVAMEPGYLSMSTLLLSYPLSGVFSMISKKTKVTGPSCCVIGKGIFTFC